MEDLKQAIVMAPCLRLIDYHCDRWVILAVNSSCIATGFILLQLSADSKRYPSHFGSITWNNQESCYSQAKIEIYGLWHALQAYHLYIIGIKNLCVEINASYIKGMLNNPDIQPGTAVNRWIVGIKLFHFDLIHVLGKLHDALDSLSYHAQLLMDPIADKDLDDWLDRTMGFAVVLMNSTLPWSRHFQCSPVLPSSLLAPYSAYSAYFQEENTPLHPSLEIPCSQQAQLTDDRLNVVQSSCQTP